MPHYHPEPLHRDQLDRDPFVQFGRWFADAQSAAIDLAEGVVLATATSAGRPSIRTVLLKGFDERGFVFFTNYRSRKGRELEENRAAALLFWWKELARQVRVEGTVTPTTEEESNAYFATRPRGSQLGAWASEQSEIIPSRAALEEATEQMAARFGDGPIPRPPHWGGYRLHPLELEFWQGQPDRLHDRFVYSRDGARWKIARVAP
ncbi:MAG: pyridoxamine 5'-phosphate oxidase [Thermoanaerobaculia bacterium]